MRKKRSVLLRLLPWILVLAALAALIFFVFIPIYSQQEEPISEAPVVHQYDGITGKLTMENDALLFEMDRATTQFSIQDKRTGKVWYSNPQDRDKDTIALAANKEMLSSTLNVTYTTSGGEVELNNFVYSMQNQNFVLTEQEDGSLRVDYAIGKIERNYLLPTAITAERFKAFSDKMSKSTKKKLSSNYSLYEPETLGKKDNRDEIIALYPSVETQALYVLKSDTSAKNKEKIEGYFAEAGYTQEDYNTDLQLVAQAQSNNGPVFNASMIYRLDGEELVVEVPYSSLRCENDTPLTYISVLPMFGAAGADQQGFMMIPEGGGALIRYNNGKLSQNAYYANLYGWDYATERIEAVNETRNAFPVFGMGQEDGSFICVMEGASAYGGICADIAGRYNSYNYAYAKYNVLHYDRFNVSGRTAQLLYMYEKQIPEDTIVQRYHFIEGNNYVDMAHAYREYICRDERVKASQASEEIPVNVELVGAINKIVPFLGVPVDSVIPVTTFDEAGEIMNELQSAGVRELNLRMTGWCNGGVRQKVLTGVHIENALGGKNGMEKLISAAKNAGVHLYFDGISCFAYDSDIFDGFLPFSNAARFTTREQAKLYAYDIVTYQRSEWMDEYYLVRPDYAARNASNLLNELKKDGADGVAFRDIGNLLSADYYNQNTVTREQVKRMNMDTLQEAKNNGLRVSVKEGNEYAVPWADLITNMNLTGNAYAIIDERIPFYQIALHGLKDYTSESVNLAGDYRTVMLECAEYGAGLCFTFMKEDTPILQDTAYSCYTSASYDRWKKEIIPEMVRYQEEMTGLNRMLIVDHSRLADNVTATTYDDGTTVYVNYSDADFDENGVTVGARDYRVERGNGK